MRSRPLSGNYELAAHFQKAIDEIDKSIDHLQKTMTHCWVPTGTCDLRTT